MLPVTRKDILPTTQKNYVMYEYNCHSDSRYVERTSQRPVLPVGEIHSQFFEYLGNMNVRGRKVFEDFSEGKLGNLKVSKYFSYKKEKVNSHC